MAAFGIDAVSEYLDEHNVQYEVVEHRITYTAAAEARAAGIPVDDVAKTVVLHGSDGGYRLAVIPASQRLDLQKARAHFGDVRMASEDEMRSDLRSFEIGAVPPFAGMINATEAFDERLLGHEQILCSGGDHRHSLLLSPEALVRLVLPDITDLCME